MSRWLPAALLVLSLGLSACSSEPEATRDEAGDVATAGEIDAFAIDLSDCLVEPPATGDQAEEVADVSAVPCAEPHDGEVYALFDLPDGDFPGDEAVTTAADERCVEEFDTFVGKAYEDSALDFFTFTPTKDSWELRDDREVVCVIGDPEGGQTTGSLKGAAR